ncbi:MAG: tRNA lysidine(34) synthetase TilS [Flavicella sp.]
MLDKFRKQLQKSFPKLQKSNVLIAISGGIDSVVLAHLMHHFNGSIGFAHCNFQLREKESDADELFVKQLAETLSVTAFTKKFDTIVYAKEKGLSIQMAARELRYAWFEEIASTHSYEYILTAHHKEDVLETFIINLTRGTGLDGLLGIPKKNGKIRRPLLNFTRQEIADYAQTNDIEWREDKSNASSKYLRNKIRHDIVPTLKEINPKILDNFDKTLKHLNESNSIVKDRVESLKRHVMSIDDEGVLSISIRKINELKNPKANLYELLKPYGFSNSKDVTQLLKAQSGKQLFSKTHRLIKDREQLLLTTLKNNGENYHAITEDTKEINTPIHLEFNTVKKLGVSNKNTAYIDKNLLNDTLIVRKHQKGDYFYPIGMQGKKKISKYFKDEKLSLLEKEETWLLCNGNEIVWVIGRRLDNRYKVTTQTQSIFEIKYH